MGKYSGSSTQRESSISKPKELPGIWSLIGCVMILVIPAISIAAGIETVNYALSNKWNIPFQLRGFPVLPEIVKKSSGLLTIFGSLVKINNFYAFALASLLYIVAISTMISLVYAVVYRVINPNRYGPTDEPPSKVKVRKKSR